MQMPPVTGLTYSLVTIQNCDIPSDMSGPAVVNKLRIVLRHLGQIVLFKSYVRLSSSTPSTEEGLKMQSELSLSGVSLMLCPPRGKKMTADPIIIADMMAFALDNPAPAVIVLISGNGDFSYALSLLNGRQYTILVVIKDNAPDVLQSAATAVLDWRLDVLTLASSSRVAPPTCCPNHSPKAMPAKWTTSETPGQHLFEYPDTAHVTGPLFADDERHPYILGVSSSRRDLPSNSGTLSPLLAKTSGISAPSFNGYYKDLVAVLRALISEGQPRPLRSTVGLKLLQGDPKIYSRATGPSSFKEYVKAAQDKGLVELGGEGGNDWISLTP
ncbi:hypothetical protein DFJ77DRAFT_318690 [Powellomyces hirtus]|nr:hypothetical protein DFJ77DRAFT_318690 [Powellomyces hirtus]